MNNHGSTRDASAKETAGWLEAAIAWEVCASLHRKFCKGKDALFSTRQADYVRHAEDARKKAQERPDADEIAVENYKAKWDAELGRTAMKFVDRAGDVHPGIDGADRICAEFYKAMCEVIERMPHVQKMSSRTEQDNEEQPSVRPTRSLLSPAEQQWILASPVAISVLMDAIDLNHSKAASVMESDEIPPWPPKRYKELKALGRSIVARDPDCFEPEVLRTFGFQNQKSPTSSYEELLAAAEESRKTSRELLNAQAKTLNGKWIPIDPSWVEPFETALKAQERLYAAIDAARASKVGALVAAKQCLEMGESFRALRRVVNLLLEARRNLSPEDHELRDQIDRLLRGDAASSTQGQ